MSDKDFEIAGKIGNIAGRFTEAWQEYQDWLRAIISSRSALAQCYPAWLATYIFRWRLLYFVVYVGSVIGRNQIMKRLKQLLLKLGLMRNKPISASSEVSDQSIAFNQTDFVLRRIATLLAVAELTLCGIAAATGVMLAFYYQPTAVGAYASLNAIAHQVSNGTLILSLHNIAGNGLIVLALVQLVVMFLGRRFLPSWLTAWISGIVLTLCAIGLSWTAIILNWDQVGFWRFKIELSIIESLPAGLLLREVLAGGSAINTLTLQHMYTLHSYVLAIAALLLSVTHLTALIFQEQYWTLQQFRRNPWSFLGESAIKGDSSTS